MDYMTLINAHAHWLFIKHNQRNNKRTKPAKK